MFGCFASAAPVHPTCGAPASHVLNGLNSKLTAEQVHGAVTTQGLKANGQQQRIRKNGNRQGAASPAFAASPSPSSWSSVRPCCHRRSLLQARRTKRPSCLPWGARGSTSRAGRHRDQRTMATPLPALPNHHTSFARRRLPSRRCSRALLSKMVETRPVLGRAGAESGSIRG